MDVQKEEKSLRESMSMNRKEFCEYFGIPYRTVTDWEFGKRSMPDYIFRLMEYKVRAEKMLVKDQDQEPVQRCDNALVKCKVGCSSESILSSFVLEKGK